MPSELANLTHEDVQLPQGDWGNMIIPVISVASPDSVAFLAHNLAVEDHELTTRSRFRIAEVT